MQRFKIDVVEDEEECSKMLTGYLRRYCAEEGMEADIRIFSSADSFLKDYAGGADIIFMDICMEGTDGMTAAHKLRTIDNEVMLIFVTTMAKFAVEGYEVNAFNYIVKPVDYYEFRLKIDKAFKRMTDGRDKLKIMLNGEQHWLSHKDLVYVDLEKKETKLNSYDLEVHIPKINIDNPIIEEYNAGLLCSCHLEYLSYHSCTLSNILLDKLAANHPNKDRLCSICDSPCEECLSRSWRSIE